VPESCRSDGGKTNGNLGLAVLFNLLSATAETSDTTVQGVLIDRMCSYKAETRIVPGGLLAGGIITIYPHTRQCALMPECQKRGVFE
jgi:hypothetical protein